MVIPSLLIKGALVVAGAGIVSSATVGTIVTYRKSMLGSSQEEMEGLEKKCYVIPTEGTIANSQDKLLICNLTYENSSRYSQYLFKREQEKGGGEENIILAIEKSGDKLKVSWQGLEGDSSGRYKSTNKSEELKINRNGWDNIQEKINLIYACYFVSVTDTKSGANWQCGKSSVKGSSEVTFQLTPFEGEITSLNGKEN